MTVTILAEPLAPTAHTRPNGVSKSAATSRVGHGRAPALLLATPPTGARARECSTATACTQRPARQRVWGRQP